MLWNRACIVLSSRADAWWCRRVSEVDELLSLELVCSVSCDVWLEDSNRLYSALVYRWALYELKLLISLISRLLFKNLSPILTNIPMFVPPFTEQWALFLRK